VTPVAVVTGARGFLGRALVAHLQARGWEVRGLDVQDGDIARPGGWQRAMEGADVVVHAAAVVGMPAPRRPRLYWEVNTLGTHHVLSAARASRVRRVLVLSSVVTFGLDFPDQVDETYPVRPTGVPYADTKIAAEQVALAAHARGDVEVVVVRPGDVYGPGSIWVCEPLRLLPRRAFAVPATGVFSPVHVDDVVRALATAAVAPAAGGQVLTVSGGIGVPAGDFFDHLGALLARPVPRLPVPVLLAGAAAQGGLARVAGRSVTLSPDAVRYVGLRHGTYAIGRARDVLDWSPQVSLEEGMAQVGEWARAAGLARQPGRGGRG
jgi:nucleoside-diphosphate-sugar epimerase